MALAQVNGVRIHYERAGRGPHVVMVHGLAANVAFWYLKLVPRLASDFSITVYDLRGHGLSEMPPSGYDPASMSHDLAALLDHLGIDRPHLVGHSFGGSILLQYALDYPERVRSLTLADAALYALQPLDSGRDWAHWDDWRRRLEELGIAVPPTMPRVAFGLLEELADSRWVGARQRNRSDAFFVPFGLWNGARRSAAGWLRLLRTTTAWREFCEHAGLTLERIRTLRVPVLLIYGQRSRWLETCAVLGRALPDCRTVVLPGVGHFHPLLRPALFTHHLRGFLLSQALR